MTMFTPLEAINRLCDKREIFYDEMVDLMRQVMDLLVGIPSVVYGIFGLTVVLPLVSRTWLADAPASGFAVSAALAFSKLAASGPAGLSVDSTGAEQAAAAHRGPALFYPGLNRVAAELLIGSRKKGWGGFDAKSLDPVRASLDEQIRVEPDFWSVVGKTELRLYETLAAGALAAERASIEHELDDLHVRMDAPANWDSVLVQLDFVLPRYAERASKAEAAAATGLLKHVRQLRDQKSERAEVLTYQP